MPRAKVTDKAPTTTRVVHVDVKDRLMWSLAEFAKMNGVGRDWLTARLSWGAWPGAPGDPSHGLIRFPGGRDVPVHQDGVGFAVVYAAEARRVIEGL